MHASPDYAMTQAEPDFQVRDFGLTDYETIWALQKTLVQARLAGEIPDMLLIGEHPPVITLGRGSHAQNLLNPTVSVLEIERGGDVTYHGPGQLVVYPIFLLSTGQRDLHHFLRLLEESIILCLKAFQLEGIRNPGWTGIWIEPRTPQAFKSAESMDRHLDSTFLTRELPPQSTETLQPSEDARLLKLASIGVAVKKWVTYHGLALNVSTDLAHFRQINPCGLESQVMTSMSEHLQKPVDMQSVKDTLIQSIGTVFQAK
jgi:lipoyl(octanoyl) transferase